jgi:hypothetical protein
MKRLILVLLVLCFASLAHAQSGIELTPYFGYRGGGEISSDTLEFFGELEIDEGESYGLIVGFPIAPWAMIELEASFQDSVLVQAGGDFLPGAAIANIDVDYYHVGFVFQGAGPKVQPFGIFTLGATNINPKLEGLTSETKFSTSFGGGLKLNFSQNFGLRLEGRGYYTLIDTNDDYYCCYYYTDDLWQVEGRVGLIVRF